MHSKYTRFVPPSASTEKRIDSMLAKMTLEEKIQLLGGQPNGKDGNTFGNASAGIPALKMADASVGIHWWCKTSTAYPASIALSATYDKDLAYKTGAAVGRDARARGVHILLGPGVNIYRSAYCGRNFEYLGEDPALSAQMVTAYIKGCQDQGVATTVKHYAVNYQEFDRHGVSSDVDERALHEIYLPAFRAAIVDGGSGAVMTAYNPVNGIHASQHDELINQILKGQWKFDGLVMSDWASTYDAVGCANGGLDLEMPIAYHMNNQKLLPAVKDGRVSEKTIDDKIRRLLRLAICFGWLDHPQQDPSIPMEDESTAAVALEVARKGFVLLKNEGAALPLSGGKIRKIAVIGPNVHPAVLCGGGSAYTQPWRQTSILEGIRAAADATGSVEVVHFAGVDPWRQDQAFANSVFATPEGKKGLRGEYFNNLDLSGTPVLVRDEPNCNMTWYEKPIADGVDKDNFSARYIGTLTPPKTGRYTIYTSTSDGHSLVKIGDQVIADTWVSEHNGPTRVTIDLEGGRTYPFLAQYRRTRGWNSIRAGWEPAEAAQLDYAQAIAAAREADVVIFCGGHTAKSESEGFDRGFGMPTEVEDMLVDVAGINPNTVVVLTAGGNVDMRRWVGSVKAILHAWYLGQEGGRAVAEILFGKVNPSGKLPATFEKQPEDRSSFNCYHDADGDKRVKLTDGIFCGYRHHDRTGIEPMFPFGFGLSYTTFEYQNIELSAQVLRPGQTVRVEFDIINTGAAAGAEVAQVYVRDAECSLPRPIKELKAFARVELQPGERKRVAVKLREKDLAFYAPGKGWTVEPGMFNILVGASSADIRLRATLRYESK